MAPLETLPETCSTFALDCAVASLSLRYIAQPLLIVICLCYQVTGGVFTILCTLGRLASPREDTLHAIGILAYSFLYVSLCHVSVLCA